MINKTIMGEGELTVKMPYIYIYGQFRSHV